MAHILLKSPDNLLTQYAKVERMVLVDQERKAALLKNKGDNLQCFKPYFEQLVYNNLRLVLISFLIMLTLQTANSAEVSFSWNETDGAAGYKIYYGVESRTYPFVVDIGLWTQCTVSGLDNGQIYYFAVTAYNGSEESEFSDELTCCSHTCDADIDFDGDIDGSDLKSIIVDPSAISVIDFAAGFGTENCVN